MNVNVDRHKSSLTIIITKNMKIKILCILLLSTYIFLGEISAENQIGKFLTQFIFKFLLSKDSIVSKKTAEENQFNQVLIREKRSKPNQETEKTNEKRNVH